MAPITSLKFRIAAVVFFVGSLMMLGVLMYVLQSHTQHIYQQQQEHNDLLAQLLSGLSYPALLTDDYTTLQPYLEELTANTLINQVMLQDHSDRVVASSKLQSLGEQAPVFVDSEQSYWGLYPIAGTRENLGSLAIEFSSKDLQESERWAYQRGGALSLFAMGLLAILAWIFAYGLTRRLDALAGMAQRIAQGEWHYRIELKGRDELAEMGLAFDKMAAQIEKDQRKLRQTNANLEQRVIERTAALEAANHELESFAYSVSHDLRAPLRGVDGFSQALLEDYGAQMDATAQDYLQRICRGARRMGELIDDLLKLSRLNQIQPNYQDVDLTHLAEEVVHDLQDSIPSHQPHVDIEQGIVVHSDEGMVRIVLENLLGNAWKFTSKSNNPLISLCCYEVSDDRYQLCIQDNGDGFDMLHADKLFVPFQRLHRQDEFEGNGIGLATVQRIIHRLNGQLEAVGEPGKGARICFTLARPGSKVTTGLGHITYDKET